MSDDPSPIPPVNSPEPSIEPRDNAVAPLPVRTRNGQRIAEASWIFCGLAIILTLISNAVQPQSRTTATVFGATMLVLLVLGLLLALIALAGMRKWRNPDILRPAGVGLILSLCLLGLTARAMIVARRQQDDQRSKAIAEQQRMNDATREALLDSGWLAIIRDDSLIVMLTSMPNHSPLCAGLLEKLNTDASVILVNAENHGKESRTIDPRDAVITLTNGSQITALDFQALLKNARSDRDALQRAYSPPLTIGAEARASALMLFPANVDWANVRTLTCRVNGQSQVIVGQYVTKEQKSQMLTPPRPPATQAP